MSSRQHLSHFVSAGDESEIGDYLLCGLFHRDYMVLYAEHVLTLWERYVVDAVNRATQE